MTKNGFLTFIFDEEERPRRVLGRDRHRHLIGGRRVDPSLPVLIPPHAPPTDRHFDRGQPVPDHRVHRAHGAPSTRVYRVGQIQGAVNTGCSKYRVRQIKGVANIGCCKYRGQQIQGTANAGCGKYRVWQIQGVRPIKGVEKW